MEGNNNFTLEDHNIDYDKMSEEEYMQAMEKKVEYYKLHYPDMYQKAMQWMDMLEHSEVYKKNAGADETDPKESPEFLQAQDILKNVRYNGLEEEDMMEKDILLLNKYIPNWKTMEEK